mmetsp:Transcript_54346/g.74268  ORF Transcript_54346/g.74268 Transcript_54346/m.74268 type:complete len:139 (+) Transcript_54346:575-991(+)
MHFSVMENANVATSAVSHTVAMEVVVEKVERVRVARGKVAKGKEGKEGKEREVEEAATLLREESALVATIADSHTEALPGVVVALGKAAVVVKECATLSRREVATMETPVDSHINFDTFDTKALFELIMQSQYRRYSL